MQPNDEPEVPTQGAEPLDIARLLALCEAATPRAKAWAEEGDHFSICAEDEQGNHHCVASIPYRNPNAENDLKFYVAARTALPDALREIASLREQVAAAKKEREGLTLRIDQLLSEGRKDHDLCYELAGKIGVLCGERDDLKAQLEQARADGQRVLDALVVLKAAVRAEPLMNHHRYAQLAIQVNNAINAFGCMTPTLTSHAYAAVQYGARSSKPTRQRTLSQSESANVSRLLYSFAVENGICTACRNRWATDGTRKCPKCRQKRAEQMREYRGKA